MEQRHRDALRRNLSVIVEDATSHDLLIDLPILTTSSKQQIEALRNQYGERRATSALVDEIQRKGPTAFFCFLAALWKNKYFHVVDCILHTLTEDEGKQFRARLALDYGERHLPERQMPLPSQGHYQESSGSLGLFSAAPQNGTSSFQNDGGHTEYDNCPLNDLPYGYTKGVAKRMNQLTADELDSLKQACPLSRGDANSVKDGASLFDMLADKDFTQGRLRILLKKLGCENKVFGSTEPEDSSGSSQVLTTVAPSANGTAASPQTPICTAAANRRPASSPEDENLLVSRQAEDTTSGTPNRRMDAESLRKARTTTEQGLPDVGRLTLSQGQPAPLREISLATGSAVNFPNGAQ